MYKTMVKIIEYKTKHPLQAFITAMGVLYVHRDRAKYSTHPLSSCLHYQKAGFSFPGYFF